MGVGSSSTFSDSVELGTFSTGSLASVVVVVVMVEERASVVEEGASVEE